MVPGALYGNNHYKTFIELLKESVSEGAVPLSRIDDAVTRILRVKYDLGLFDDPYGKIERVSQVGSKKNRQVARDAVRMSMVLLKNESNVLPLEKDKSITVVGSGANNLGMQNGGWTVEWQGRSTPDFKILDNDNDGKLNFADLARSIIADITRIAVRAFITKPLFGAIFPNIEFAKSIKSIEQGL